MTPTIPHKPPCNPQKGSSSESLLEQGVGQAVISNRRKKRKRKKKICFCVQVGPEKKIALRMSVLPFEMETDLRSLLIPPHTSKTVCHPGTQLPWKKNVVKQEFQLKCLRGKKGIAASELCREIVANGGNSCCLLEVFWSGSGETRASPQAIYQKATCTSYIPLAAVSSHQSRTNFAWFSRKLFLCLLLPPAWVWTPKSSYDLQQALPAGFLVSSLSRQSCCLLPLHHAGENPLAGGYSRDTTEAQV